MRFQGDDVGRTILQPHQFAAFGRTAVGIGVNPVETQVLPPEILLGGGVHDLDIRCAQPRKVFRSHAGQHVVALERHHAAEAAAQEECVDAQSAGEVQRRVAFDPLVGGAGFARRLFEGQRGQDALRGGIRREFLCGPCEVFDLCGDQPRMGNPAVFRHLERVAVACGGNGALYLVGQQERVFFGRYHVRKGTLFFGSALHAAAVARMKTRYMTAVCHPPRV